MRRCKRRRRLPLPPCLLHATDGLAAAVGGCAGPEPLSGCVDSWPAVLRRKAYSRATSLRRSNLGGSCVLGGDARAHVRACV
jgi:hypothetical protein